MVRESTIHRNILDAIEAKYGKNARVHKMHGNAFTGPGLQDLVGVIHGRAVAIEVKRPGEKPEPIQYHEIKLWKEAGAISGWADNVTDAMRIIEEGLCT